MSSLQVTGFSSLLLLCFFLWLPLTGAAPSNKTQAIRNVLSYYGLNDTSFGSEQMLCPPTFALNDSFKQIDIPVGLLGCTLDPLLFTLSTEEKVCLQVQDEGKCTCMSGVPGYYPLIPEYLLAVLMHFEEFNNRPDILPNHRLCIYASISLLSDAVDTVFRPFLNQPETPLVLDFSPGQTSIFVQHIVLPKNLSMVRHSHYGSLIPINGHNVWNEVSARITNRPRAPNQLIPAVQLAQERFAEYFFTAEPLGREVHFSILALAELYSWRHIAYVLADDWSVSTSRLSPGFSRIFAGSKFTTYFFSFNQPNEDLLNLFKQIGQYELQVIVFHGSVQRYFEVLLEASRYHFVGENYVWIFPYYGAIFPTNYQESSLWCNFTDHQVYTIKKALRGSLSIGVTEGLFGTSAMFKERFVEYASQVTGFPDVYRQNTRFQQTPHIYDMAGIIGKAMDEFVRAKAILLNTSTSMVNVSYDDRKDVSNFLHQTVLDEEAVAGNLSFDSQGDRDISYFVVRNFIPLEDNNFTVNTSRVSDPWVVQIRGCLKNRPRQGEEFEMWFFEGNATSTATKLSTVLFASGTTTPPPDRPIRMFRRSHSTTVATTTVSTLVFFVAIFVYVTWIFYEDKKRDMYNSSWMFNENDLHYISADQQYGIWGRLNNISKVMGIHHSRNSEDAAKLNDGSFAALIRIPFPKESNYSRKLHQECNLLRELKHPNLCPFYGCLLASTKSALLYKYYSRGTLEHLLLNSDIDFHCIFRMSFALDVANGMEYLHSKRITHGRLETKACVVDENWAVRLRDYGLKSLHGEDNISSQGKPKCSSREGERKKSVVKVAPEIRFLGTGISLPGDVFSFGYLLEDLIGTKYASKCNQATCKVSHDKEMMSPKLVGLIEDCRENNPNRRPTFETITAQLTQIYQLEHNITEQGVMHIYSRQLEERLEDLTNKVVNQKHKQNEIMRHYIPKLMVDAIIKKKEVPIVEYHNVVIMCIELTCMDLLASKLDSEAIEYILLTMQKAIEGVTTMLDVVKLQSNGNMWILAAGINSKESSLIEEIMDAVHTAFAVLDAFSGIFLPGLPYVHPTIRVGMHCGDVLCGVIEEPVPQMVAIGKSISTTIAITSKGKDGSILSSYKVGKELMSCDEFKIVFNSELTSFGESMRTTWIDLSHTEKLRRKQNLDNCHSSDSNVTIKQCVARKSTVVARGEAHPLLSLLDTSTQRKDRVNPNSYGESVPSSPLVSKSENCHPKSASIVSQSSVHLSIDSGRSSLASDGIIENEKVAEKSRSRSVSAYSASPPHPCRPWSASSEPARLIDLEDENV